MKYLVHILQDRTDHALQSSFFQTERFPSSLGTFLNNRYRESFKQSDFLTDNELPDAYKGEKMQIPKDKEEKLVKLAPEITVRPTPEFTAEQNALAQSLQELNLPEAQLTKLADQIAAFVSTAQLDAVRQGIQSAVDMMNDESYLPE